MSTRFKIQAESSVNTIPEAKTAFWRGEGERSAAKIMNIALKSSYNSDKVVLVVKTLFHW